MFIKAYKYFFWKYTAPNRYKTTTTQLKKYLDPVNNLDELYSIKEEIFSFNKNDILKGLKTAVDWWRLATSGFDSDLTYFQAISITRIMRVWNY